MRKLKLRANPYPGKLIVFEGTDGAGKTTMIGLTERYLAGRGEDVLCVKQPTDLSRKTRLFQKMMYSVQHEDIDYRAVQLLTMSDRIQHGSEVIVPALKEGRTVICDRYVYTSLANMLARGYSDERWFFEAARHLLRPDLTFLAYVPPRIAIQRIRERPSERHRYLNEELLYRVAAGFKEMAYREGFVVLDTCGEPFRAFDRVRSALEGEMKHGRKRS